MPDNSGAYELLVAKTENELGVWRLVDGQTVASVVRAVLPQVSAMFHDPGPPTQVPNMDAWLNGWNAALDYLASLANDDSHA